ncbi:MAG: LbtU family siderophore porin [Gammaproteobacteria bacterium]|nr:LbtU family siderophore porin [Gammaproteobacteria bacterium]MBU1558695.1 LbtU family siderophore porin [Gammaproteobacteria bacterium]MBU1926746.1 LbtU family siderophore porin [Gammaproteobacteria bacterium]MBU2546456.1 LbtU family siderophore porin [Gammaproteobacteria bacterium]
MNHPSRVLLNRTLFLICSCSLVSTAFAAAPLPRHHRSRHYVSARSRKEAQLQSMEKQLSQLEVDVQKMKKELQTEQETSQKIKTRQEEREKSVASRFKTYGSAVVIAPYTGRPTYSTGSQVLVNSPSINEDLKLLERRKVEQEALKKAGEKVPNHPRLVMSGKLSGEFSYSRPYKGARSTDIDLSGAELDTFAEISPLVNGFMAFTYDNNPNDVFSNRRIGNSNVYLDKGFIVIGDVKRSPFYGTVGQMYVPFGRYSTMMISSPLTKYIGKTKARTILVGFAPARSFSPYARAFVFKGDTKYGNSSLAKQFGGDAGISYIKKKFNTDVGVSYISNMADSVGMQDTGAPSGFQGFDKSNREDLVHGVNGIDLHAVVGYGPWSLIAEYLSALQQFSKTDLSFNSHGAEPSAMNVEGDYSFHLFRIPSSVALSYAFTNQALGLYLPKQRYTAGLLLNILQNATLTFEYRHDINYGRSNTAMVNHGATLAYVPSELGRSDDMISTELSVYF